MTTASSSAADEWPPPPTGEHDEFRLTQLRLRPRGALTDVRVRPVWLWGAVVLIDEHTRVYCPDCWSFIDLEVLGSYRNTHRVGLRPRRSGALLPMGDDPAGGGRYEEGF